MSEIKLNLTINGKNIKRSTKSHYRLLDFLREDLDLTGTRKGVEQVNVALVQYLLMVNL